MAGQGQGSGAGAVKLQGTNGRSAGAARPATPAAGAPRQSRNKLVVEDSWRQAAPFTVVAVIGHGYAKKENGNTYFGTPGALGYIIKEKASGKLEALTRAEAVKKSLIYMKEFRDKKASAGPLLFDNAIHAQQSTPLKEKVTSPDGVISRVPVVDPNTKEPVYKKTVHLEGLNGIILISEGSVADSKAENNSYYESKENAQNAAKRYRDVVSGTIPATDELKKLLTATAKSGRTGGGSAPRAKRDPLQNLDQFLAETADILKNVADV